MPTSQKVFVRPIFIGDSFDLGQWLANKIRVWILEETIKHHYPELVANANANKEVRYGKLWLACVLLRLEEGLLLLLSTLTYANAVYVVRCTLCIAYRLLY